MLTTTAYRRKGSNLKANQENTGTFYFITLPDGDDVQDYDVFNFEFKNDELLVIHQEGGIEVYVGLPSEFLAHKWFPCVNWYKEMFDLNLDSVEEAMDYRVAERARQRGFKAIQYGKYELQVVG
jgi:hypothetical protein